ncbi:hypothetical protein BO221_14060 [Archangium sp. Cb G35]|uniref:hypothetical protein n=1 Tax=Archangium sp. Cb G35 TaxID=1920190 RepID=UPI000937F322|nr:hypothetical protein [Archangium sp. Cb G35]OJT24296.1 hypothetical protein BO221_14060 [Archangium sp. Cb G35]
MKLNPQNLPQVLGELLGAGLVALAVRESFRRARWDVFAAAGMTLLRAAAGPVQLESPAAASRRWVH